VSRELLEAWCEDQRNCVIIADFAVQGTLAREILTNPPDIITKTGARLPLRCQVDAISFSAHADFSQTSEFLDELRPPHVVLVHGEAAEMGRLKKALEQHAAALGIPRAVYAPKLTQPVIVPHKPRRTARVLGRLAEKRPSENGAPLRGILVKRGGNHMVVHHEDLPKFTKLHPGTVIQRQALTIYRPFAEVRLALELMFEGIQGTGDLGAVSSEGGEVLRIGNMVTVAYHAGVEKKKTQDRLVLEWTGGAEADMIADAVVAVALGAAGMPPGVSAAELERHTAMKEGDVEALSRAETRVMVCLLEAQFGPAQEDTERGAVFVDVDGTHVIVDPKTGKVQCADDGLKARVEKAVRRMMLAMKPCPLHSEA